MSDDVVDFLKKSRELLDYCSRMEMATKYRTDAFNYGEYRFLLHAAVKEVCSKEEVLKIYSQGLR
ncbi:MAG: hypothetical protein RSA29_17795 [Clostridium sp.]|uniref:hypothetical protein n=1 Tax=Clostridium sp. TaxID=1506 RepID=UPI003052302B